MTQEQKAKAYDEALKRAKFYHGNCPSEPERRKLEKMFPMLRESKDDRIRKSLIKFLTDIKEISESGRTTWAVRKEDAEMCKSFLAYLEKQKESLPISEIGKENANTFADGIIEVRSFQRGMEEGRRLERQKEQNGEDEFLEDELSAFLQNYDKEYDDDAAVSDVARHFYEIGKKQKEHKPQTDDEKEYVRTIKSIISDFIRDKKPENLAYYQRIYDWLDGRHVPFSCGHENGKPADPVFSKQEYESYPIISEDTTSAKPAEWSKEDEEMRGTCIDLLEHFPRTCGEVIGPWKDCIAWLKSLRPQPQGIYQQVVKGIRDMCDRYEQNGMFTDERARDFLGNVRVKCKDAIECAPILDEPSWKPNEEQMEALDKARRFIPYNCDALESLYVDLKKL